VGILYQPPFATALRNATFKFAALSPGKNASHPVACPGCLFYCSLDNVGGEYSHRPCDPGTAVSYTDLDEGVHTFSVYAVDVFGNVGAESIHTWQVNSSLPLSTVVSGPGSFGVTNDTSAVLRFVGTLKNLPCLGCSYQCKFNDGPFQGCDAGMPFKLLNLQQGQQSLVVQVTDVRGVFTLSAPYE
jgi:hypothetical protein